jgi:transmembrane sensor
MSSSQDTDNEHFNDQLKENTPNGSLEEMEHNWEYYHNYKGQYSPPNIKIIWAGIVKKIGWSRSTRKTPLVSFLKYAAAILLPIAGFLLGLHLSSNFSEITEAEKISLNTTSGVSTRANLSDGSVVWLRSNSEIIYPQEFSDKERAVELKGQAYFKIRPDSLWPFVVRAGDFSATALGTELIMKTNPELGIIETALVSGKARIEWTNKDNVLVQRILQPMELVVYSTEQRHIESVSPLSETTAQWNHYFLAFEGVPLGETLKKMADSYNMQLQVAPGVEVRKPVTITVREESFEQILSLLQYIVPFDYAISKDTIYISPKNLRSF